MAKASLGGKGQCLTVCSHVKKQSCHSRFFRLNYIVRERETKDFRGTKLVVMSIMNPGDSTHLGTDALDVVKGYTKITVIMFTLLACAELDPENPADMKKLQPLWAFLDKAWLLPANVPQAFSNQAKRG